MFIKLGIADDTEFYFGSGFQKIKYVYMSYITLLTLQRHT